MRNHLKRKIPCPPHFSDESLDELSRVFEAESNACTCTLCGKTLTSQQYLDVHANSCNSARGHHPTPIVITNNIQINVTNNNVTNNNVTVILRAFGNEDRSYVGDDIMKLCCDTLSVLPIIKAIYCDPAHPENYTIRIKSEKRKLVEVRENDSWVERDMSSTIDAILRGEYDNIARHFYAHVWTDDSIDYATRAFAQERLVKVKYDKIRLFQERRNALILLRRSLRVETLDP